VSGLAAADAHGRPLPAGHPGLAVG
jgi:hypothetical protein